MPLVLVDALNVTRSRWPNLLPERFVDATHAWASRNGVDVIIIFDGEAPAGLATESVVGAGGSADDWIAEHAPGLGEPGRSVWLVSSDRELRSRVAPHVARVIGGGAFASELEAVDPSRATF